MERLRELLAGYERITNSLEVRSQRRRAPRFRPSSSKFHRTDDGTSFPGFTLWKSELSTPERVKTVFQLAREIVTELYGLLLQSRLSRRRVWRTSPGLLVENLSRGNHFDLPDNTGTLPRGSVQLGDVVRLSGGGMIVQGSVADLQGDVRVSSWVRSTLGPEEPFSIQSVFANAYCRGIATR